MSEITIETLQKEAEKLKQELLQLQANAHATQGAIAYNDLLQKQLVAEKPAS